MVKTVRTKLLMSRIFFPVGTLSVAAQYVSYLLPITFALDLVSYYPFGGNWDSLVPRGYECAMLLAYGVLYTIATKILLAKVDKYAKTKVSI